MNNSVSQVLGIVAPVPKGEYNPETYYEYLNIVTYNYSSYIALQSCQGVEPTDKTCWELLGGGATKEYAKEKYRWTLSQPYLGAEMGSCVLIKDRDIVMMYDCGYTGQDNLMRNFLAQKEVTHIDIFIISHFHGDHAGCQETILREYCDENTKIYIGMVPDYTRFGVGETSAKSNYENFVELCEELGYTYIIPENNSIETIDEFISLRFLNTDTTNLEDYYNSKSDTNLSHYQRSSLNNCSLIVETTIHNNKILLTGDIEVTAETKMKKYITPVDILMIPHHNYNRYGDMEFFDNTACKYAFCSRGTAFPMSLFPYFSRYINQKRMVNLYQNYETDIEFVGENGFISADGKIAYTAFENVKSNNILRELPGLENCLFEKVDLFDYSLWDSSYIFSLWDSYRKDIISIFALNSSNQLTALVSELTTKFGIPESNYTMIIYYRHIDIIQGTVPFTIYRIYRYPTNENQKYVKVKEELITNKTLTGNDINSANVAQRKKIQVVVTDSSTNQYTLLLDQASMELNTNVYKGYDIIFSGNTYLSFIGLQVTFNGTGYTINKYFRIVFNVTSGTITVNTTDPSLVSVTV